MAITFRQGTMLWNCDGSILRGANGRMLFGEVDVCQTCGENAPSPHHHLRADIGAIVRELRLLMAPSQPTQQPEPFGQREHLTLKQLANYSGFSIRWLRDRIRDAVDPLAASGRGGKLTVRRSDYDSWIARRRDRDRISVSGIVDDVVAKLGRR